MGGYGSGRTGGRSTVEGGLTLNIGKLIRDRTFRPGCDQGGSIVWANTDTGERVASIGYRAYLGPEEGRAQLHYTTTRWDGEQQTSNYCIELRTTTQPFGGRRWWFICPSIGVRVAKLHLPNGGIIFASRRAYRLGYRSQRETPRDRALSRAFKLRDLVGGTGGIGDYIRKPDGMRWATFDRRIAKIEAAEEIVECHGRLLLDKLKKLES